MPEISVFGWIPQAPPKSCGILPAPRRGCLQKSANSQQIRPAFSLRCLRLCQRNSLFFPGYPSVYGCIYSSFPQGCAYITPARLLKTGSFAHCQQVCPQAVHSKIRNWPACFVDITPFPIIQQIVQFPHRSIPERAPGSSLPRSGRQCGGPVRPRPDALPASADPAGSPPLPAGP